MLLASGKWRSGLLLSILGLIGQPLTQQRIIQSETSAALRSGSLALHPSSVWKVRDKVVASIFSDFFKMADFMIRIFPTGCRKWKIQTHHIFAIHSIWNVMCVVANWATYNNCHPNNTNSYDEQSQRVCPYTELILRATALRSHGQVLQCGLFSPRVCMNKEHSWQQVWGTEQWPYIFGKRKACFF